MSRMLAMRPDGSPLSYHQTFIDAVRSTGGKNAYRVLVVQGPMTDIATTNKLMTKMPNDSIPNRLIAEITTIRHGILPHD